jgi:hypothetical protein
MFTYDSGLFQYLNVCEKCFWLFHYYEVYVYLIYLSELTAPYFKT